MRTRRPLLAVAAALVVVAAAALYWFQPWRLVTDTTVDDALAPTVATGPAGTGPTTGSAGAGSAGPPRITRRGSFVTQEHDTVGEVRVVDHPDGRRTLEIAGLATSDGPDLRVWLSDQPVLAGRAGWRIFDDGRWVELGRLKGNRGDQVYEIPPGTDLTTLGSVSIWCRRFGVSFGAAALA